MVINNNKGFTLIEILLVLVIGATIIGAAFSLQLFGWRSFNIGTSQASLQQQARLIDEIIRSQIRNVRYIGFEKNDSNRNLNLTNDFFQFGFSSNLTTINLHNIDSIAIEFDSISNNMLRYQIIVQEANNEFVLSNSLLLNNIQLNQLFEQEKTVNLPNDILYYAMPGIALSSFLFKNEDVENFRLHQHINNWTKVTGQGFRSGYGILFIENKRNEYTISLKAQLTQESTSGGFGILIEVDGTNPNDEKGYILQFDRGFGHGEIILARLENGDPQGGNVYRTSTGDRAEPPFPGNKLDPWWTEEHEITVTVSNYENNPDQKIIIVAINGEIIVDHSMNWIIDAVSNLEQNLTGLRAWGGHTLFKELSIQ